MPFDYENWFVQPVQMNALDTIIFISLIYFVHSARFGPSLVAEHIPGIYLNFLIGATNKIKLKCKIIMFISLGLARSLSKQSSAISYCFVFTQNQRCAVNSSKWPALLQFM